MSISNSEKLRPILEKNADIMLQIANKLSEYDNIGQNLLTKLGVNDECKIQYDVNTLTIAELVNNTVVIQPHYFLDKEKSELEFAIAHEIGHYKYPLLNRLSMYIPFLSLGSYYCFKFNKLGILSVVFLSGATLFSTCLLKRQEEMWCDNFALSKVGKAGGINFFTSLSLQANNKNKDQSFFAKLFSYDFTHPSFSTRLKNIQNFKD